MKRMLRCKSATKKLFRHGCRHPVAGLRPVRALLVMKRPREWPLRGALFRRRRRRL